MALSGLALLIAAAPIAGGVLGAFVVAVVVERPYRRLSALVGPERGAAVTLVLCLLLLVIPAVVVGDVVLEQVRAVYQQGLVVANWRDILRTGSVAGEMGDALQRIAATATSSVAGIATWVAASAAHSVVNVIVMFLCLYFVLRSGDALWMRARAYLPFSAESSEMLRSDLRRVTEATVLGTLLSAVLQGTSMAIGFALAGLPAPALWGMITAFASMLPVLGSSLVWIPALILLVARHQTNPALIIVAFGWLLPSAIDKVTRARVSRRVGNVHPLTTLLGALVGIRLFGIVGLVAGPLMISLFVVLLQLYERDYGAPTIAAAPSSS